jgi:hypothetical protein
MDAKFREILDALPNKPPRSRLEPYRELIEELRRRGRTYVDIAGILAEKCQVQPSKLPPTRQKPLTLRPEPAAWILSKSLSRTTKSDEELQPSKPGSPLWSRSQTAFNSTPPSRCDL